mmetsp:Transcript_6023/g.10479  ORF Transcript_6023/g.10479 Transcript_6023/m.10479 type:complete len:246 (-) Transcript_6023:274-1011(-)
MEMCKCIPPKSIAAVFIDPGIAMRAESPDTRLENPNTVVLRNLNDAFTNPLVPWRGCLLSAYEPLPCHVRHQAWCRLSLTFAVSMSQAKTFTESVSPSFRSGCAVLLAVVKRPSTPGLIVICAACLRRVFTVPCSTSPALMPEIFKLCILCALSFALYWVKATPFSSAPAYTICGSCTMSPGVDSSSLVLSCSLKSSRFTLTTSALIASPVLNILFMSSRVRGAWLALTLVILARTPLTSTFTPM